MAQLFPQGKSHECQKETFGRMRSVSFFTHSGEPETPYFDGQVQFYAPKAGEFTDGVEIDAPVGNDAGCRIRRAVWIARASGRDHGLECEGRRHRGRKANLAIPSWTWFGHASRRNV